MKDCPHSERVPTRVNRELRIDVETVLHYKIDGEQCRKCRRKFFSVQEDAKAREELRKKFTPKCQLHLCARCGESFP